MVCFLVGAATWSFAQSGSVGKGINQILAVSADKAGEQPAVHITTRDPVGYRYTVYDSSDPMRVVIDFPGMDVTGIASPIKVDSPPVREIRVSSFDLTSGRLGRVELLLTAQTPYNVFQSGNVFRVNFAQSPGGSPSTPVGSTEKGLVTESEITKVATPVVPPQDDRQAVFVSETPETAGSPAEPSVLAKVAESVEVKGNQATLNTDGRIERFQHFTLGAPPRLVVDLFGVKPSFRERAFKAAQGFKGIRVGTYPDKTRFVFDAAGGRLPKYTVDKKGSAVVVGWGEQPAQGTPKTSKAPSGRQVTVEAVDFKVDNGKSLLWVALSGPADVIDAEQKDNVIRFGLKNALISRALRRSVDASAFPSAVRLITPYTTQSGKTQDVRFAVELKGPSTYSLQKKAGGLEFVVDNGPFAEAAPPAVSQMEVPVPPTPIVKSRPIEAMTFPPPTPGEESKSLGMPWLEPEKYSGQKISLVFDDADIRRILQLIAEVSDLNIIASDDVKGTITLRLIDVPWDQALDLIMDIKGLGMVREGNVVRIMPQDQIRAAAETRLTAARTQEKLEDLVTEVISVSYTNLPNVAGPAKELLTERGKLTEDARNKKLIVKDIPAVVAEIRSLVSLLDTPERQVMIEARIVEADSTFTRNLGVSWAITYNDNDAGSGDLSSAAVSGGGNFVISPVAGNAGLGSSITFGRALIDSTVLDLRISALETSRQGKVISTPRVSTLNGQAATISQGTKIPYQSSGTDGLPKTEFVDANLELTVTPEINPDNSIILDISASNSSPTLVDGATAPGIATKEAKTKLLVRDGETTVIGGIFVEDTSDSESGIPYLRKIPYLGQLFKSTTKSNNRSELLIFITPRIVR
jgi:type IV pilus assembly protein PilQ